MYDPRIGRWFATDAYEKEYVPISPYVFSLNNPIKFVDADGNVVVDSEGNPVTITVTEGKDGSYNAAFEFVEGTSQNVKDKFSINGERVIKSLIQIESGRDIVQKTQEVSHKVNIAISPGTHKKALGVTRILEEDGKNVGAQVIIFEGAIKTVPPASTQAQEYKLYGLTPDQKVASNAAHELKHATNKLDTEKRNKKEKLTTSEHQSAKNAGKVAAIEFGENNNKVKATTVKPKEDKK